MTCLIKHKNDADVKINYKCRAAVDHFQLISLNDYHFTVAFKDACRPYVIHYCPKAHTKAQVSKSYVNLSKIAICQLFLNSPHSCRWWSAWARLLKTIHSKTYDTNYRRSADISFELSYFNKGNSLTWIRNWSQPAIKISKLTAVK